MLAARIAAALNKGDIPLTVYLGNMTKVLPGKHRMASVELVEP